MSVLACFDGTNFSSAFSVNATFFLNTIKKSISPQKTIPIDKKQNKNRHRSASLTAEAAMALPLFFYTSFMLWQCFLLLLLQISVCQKVTTVALTSGCLGVVNRLSEKEELSLLYKTLLLVELQSEERAEQLEIEVTQEEVIQAEIRYVFMCESCVLPMIRIPVCQTFCFTPYVGETVADLYAEEKKPEEDVVYVTATGTVYHESKSCVYLMVRVSEVPYPQITGKRNTSGKKYTACSRCITKAEPDKVYISAGGERYHQRADCPALKRVVQERKRAEVELPSCSRCGKETEE